MILYLTSGLVITLGIIQLFHAILGDKKNHGRLGAYIIVYFYTIAVFLPFNYMTGIVLFGLCALSLLSYYHKTKHWKRAVATAATFIALIGIKIGIEVIGLDTDDLTPYVLTALVFFVVSSFAASIRMHIDKKTHKTQILEIQKKMEQEKDKLLSVILIETNAFKKYTVQHLKTTLEYLDLFKLEDVEKSIKELIARNQTDEAESETKT